MASRDKILFLIGEKKAEDLRIRKFFGKFSADQQNKIAKSILLTIIDHAGEDWNPILDGYPFLSKSVPDQGRWVDLSQIDPSIVQNSSSRFNPYNNSESSQQIVHVETKNPPLVPLPSNDTDEDNPIPVATGITNKTNKSTSFKKIK